MYRLISPFIALCLSVVFAQDSEQPLHKQIDEIIAEAVNNVKWNVYAPVGDVPEPMNESSLLRTNDSQPVWHDEDTIPFEEGFVAPEALMAFKGGGNFSGSQHRRSWSELGVPDVKCSPSVTKEHCRRTATREDCEAFAASVKADFINYHENGHCCASLNCDFAVNKRADGWTVYSLASQDAEGPAGLQFFVLNLDRRQDRLRDLSRMLHKKAPWICKRICRVPALDGQKLPEFLPRRMIPPDMWKRARERTAEGVETLGQDLTVGAVALSLGHTLMWEQMLTRKLETAVFMEDDVDIASPGFVRALKDLPTGFEYAQMEASNGKPLSVTGKWSTGGVASHLGFYALSNSAARRAITSTFPLHYQLDYKKGPIRTALKGIRAWTVIQTKGGSSDVQIGHKQDGTGHWKDTSHFYRTSPPTDEKSAKCPIPDCILNHGPIIDQVKKYY